MNPLWLLALAGGAYWFLRGAGPGEPAPTTVGVQVDKLLSEEHTSAELERAAKMLQSAGYKQDAQDVRNAIPTAIHFSKTGFGRFS